MDKDNELQWVRVNKCRDCLTSPGTLTGGCGIKGSLIDLCSFLKILYFNRILDFREFPIMNIFPIYLVSVFPKY